MADDVADRIAAFAARFMRGHQLRRDEDIFATGYVSEMFAMQLVQFLEHEFGITVEDSELEMANFASVDAMVALVARKRA